MMRGVIFDLDGTLVDSALDFDVMRREIGLPPGEPILEAIAQMPPSEARRALSVVERHEQVGAERAVLLPGVADFLAELAGRGMLAAIITRNSRVITDAVLRKAPLAFSLALTRDDGPIKPDPWCVEEIRRAWGAPRESVALIGDSIYDIQTGRRAGVRTALYTGGRARVAGAELADFVFASFEQPEGLWKWLGVDKSP
jgi:HAD superfamily hydrolase (TIGR01549 family)